MYTQSRYVPQIFKWDGYVVRYNDGPNFYTLVKDIFVNRIYHFTSCKPDPYILDCGSNIGMSILYFKHVYPQARIVGFEPDPYIYSLLEKNIFGNHLEDVQIMKAALAGGEGVATFHADGKYGGHLGPGRADEEGGMTSNIDATCLRLKNYLTVPVDFLKMNIEGAEWEVLKDCEAVLRNVDSMVIEYHHLPGLSRSLHDILSLLHRQGYEYLINDLDADTNPAVLPPFKLAPSSRYYLLIYAHRLV